MTSFILAGGGVDNEGQASYGERLSAEVHRLDPDEHLSILACFFAEDESNWDERERDAVAWYEKFFPDSNLTIASYDNFLDQVDAADVVYFHGGLLRRLVDNMKRFPDASKHLEGKVVIGSSAGAGWLGRVAWSSRAKEVVEGSGIVGKAVLTHYGALDESLGLTPEVWQEAEADMKTLANQDGVELLRLKEGEFVTIEQP